mmetsp:Transcript_63620/g.137812  ORF Transcript_63620/g.137812 Transcript_63620/m.137812 type:complete len:277 (+) Transcript_63620:498-1328(+)
MTVRGGLQGHIVLDEARDGVEELAAVLRRLRRGCAGGTAVAAACEALGQSPQTVQADEVLLDGLVVLHGGAQRPERLRSRARLSLGVQREVQERREAAIAVQIASPVHMVHQIPQVPERFLQLLVRDGGVPEGADGRDQVVHDGALVCEHRIEHVLPIDILYGQIPLLILLHELFDPVRIAVLDRPVQHLCHHVLALPERNARRVWRFALLALDHLHARRRDGAGGPGEPPAVQGQQEDRGSARPHRDHPQRRRLRKPAGRGPRGPDSTPRREAKV